MNEGGTGSGEPVPSSWFWRPGSPFAGPWPRDGTPEAAAYDNHIRPLVQALKFVGAYRAEWRALVDAHGRDAVLEALRALRAGKSIHTTIQRELYALGVLTPGVHLGAVDPEDLDDFGPPPERQPVVDTWWFLHNQSVSLAGAVSEEEHEEVLREPGRLLAVVDLNWPNSEILSAVQALRRIYGPKHPTLRPKRRRQWSARAEDGRSVGLDVAFAARRAREQCRPPPYWRIAREVCAYRDAEYEKHPAKSFVMRLVRDTDVYVREVTAAHARDRASLIPPAPLPSLPPLREDEGNE